MSVYQVLLLYLLVINIFGFLTMGFDKKSARRKKWRVSEATLFVIAIFGGCIGCIGGMYLFHHKTMKPAFQIGMPVILGLQILTFLIVYFLLPVKFRVM